MVSELRRRTTPQNLLTWLVIAAVIVAAFYLGTRASSRWLVLLLGALGATVLLIRPHLSLIGLVLAALLVPLQFNTGTWVTLNPASLLVPLLLGLWAADMIRVRRVSFVRSRTNLPLLLFLAAGLLSLLIGRATWDPMIPVAGNFLVVQLAQWAIFAFSAGAFWLTANLVKDETWLWRLTATFLLLAGGVAILGSLPGLGGVVTSLATAAFIRAPLWVLLAALAGGQLLFNHKLSLAWRGFLLATLSATLVYAFVEQQEAASNWVGLAAVLGVLVWLRFPRLRWPLLALVLILALVGVLFPAVYDFAGGDDEWVASGGSRLALIERVVDVTMRNPITGLGPAAYRPYANATPLVYLHMFWANPNVNSHNNFVDLFSHVGLVGLALLGWFVVEVARLGYRLHNRYSTGFLAGYVNGMLAAGAGALVIMMLADWILPFVYNIGFAGFQASVLVWLFLGALVAIEQFTPAQESADG